MEKKHEGGFMSGFVWGLLIGGVLVLLLTTKKGKRILNELSNAGVDIASQLNEMGIDIKEELEPVEDKETEGASSAHPSSENGKSLKKRLFRGIRRKS